MRLGAHISTAGGAFEAFPRAAAVGCETMLIFTKSNRQWAAKPLSAEDIAAFQRARAEYPAVFPVAVHASYLINVGSPDPALWQKSYAALRDEVERAEALGAEFLTFHPGSYMDSAEPTGLTSIARALHQLVVDTAGFRARVCVELMAGQGTNLGGRFEHLAFLLQAVNRPDRLGVCFDTCHAFAAGYDLRAPEAYAATLAEFDRVVGLEQILCFHFNDSQGALGSKKDRHEHIGRGQIGLDGFANFLNDPRWQGYAAHLETPKTAPDETGQEVEMDAVNLAALRELIRG